jgi:outer membrane protein insertion porin family
MSQQLLKHVWLCVVLIALVALAAGTGAVALEIPSGPAAAPYTADVPPPPPGSIPVEAPPPVTPPTGTAPATPPVAMPTLAAINIEGNQRISVDTIRAAIQSRVGQPYDPEQAARDRDAIYAQGWFSTVTRAERAAPEGVELTFHVTENVVIGGIELEGVTVFRPAPVLAVIKSKSGEVANSAQLIRDADAVEALYHEKGYTLASVVDMRIKPETNVLVLQVTEGVIDEVRITGNRRTKGYVIRRELSLKPGSVFNLNYLRTDLRRLLALGGGIFDDVTASTEVAPQQLGHVILIVTVVERKRTGVFAVGGGYSSTTGAVGFADVTESNFRGTAQQLSLRGEVGGIGSMEFSYFNPWLLNPRTSFNLGLYNRRIQREAVQSTGNFFYNERRVGGGFTLTRPKSARTSLFLTFRSDDISAGDITAEQAASLGLTTAQSVRALGVGAVVNTRDSQLFSTRGGYARLFTEASGFLGGSRFTKSGADLRRYLPAGGKRVIANRLLLGFTTGDPPFLEQFLVGGTDSLRGYQQDRFPGRQMAVASTEYRFPLGSSLTGLFFVDAGDAWGGAFAQEFGDPNFKTHLGYGVGVRIQTPVGPLRLDLGFSKEGSQTHFGIGPSF